MIYIKNLFDPQLADANHQLLKTFAKGVWCERSRKRCQDCRHANLFQYIILNFRKWFEYGLKAQKLLVPGCRVAFSERIWRLWERNRKSWERKRETWERNWATWERRILFKGHFCALRRGTIVPQVGILPVSVLKKNQLRKYPSPFIYSLESPVFIGVSEGEGCKSTLHHPS